MITAYNEQQRIGAVLDDLLQVAENIVVVDDGSRDDTAGEVLKRPVWLARHAVNLGQGAALQTGIAFALERQADYIITFDADGQHCTSDLPTLIERSPRRTPISPSVRDSSERPRAFPGAVNSCCEWPCCSRESFPEWP